MTFIITRNFMHSENTDKNKSSICSSLLWYMSLIWVGYDLLWNPAHDLKIEQASSMTLFNITSMILTKIAWLIASSFEITVKVIYRLHACTCEIHIELDSNRWFFFMYFSLIIMVQFLYTEDCILVVFLVLSLFKFPQIWSCSILHEDISWVFLNLNELLD